MDDHLRLALVGVRPGSSCSTDRSTVTDWSRAIICAVVPTVTGKVLRGKSTNIGRCPRRRTRARDVGGQVLPSPLSWRSNSLNVASYGPGW